MSYPWQCKDCIYLDESDTKWGDMYCKAKGWYVDPGSTSCSNDFAKNKEASKKDCYLTTAMCHVLEKDDKCEELEALRSFRDNYMKKNEAYIPVLEDYDKIGPVISDKILDDEDCKQVALIMKYFYIDMAIEKINEKEYEDAIDIYVNMTLDLMEHYDIDMDLIDVNNYCKKSKIRNRRKNC